MPRKKNKYIPVFLGRRVNFFNANRGFWMIGDAYKEDTKRVHVRDLVGKRHIVPNNANNINLFAEQPPKGNENN